MKIKFIFTAIEILKRNKMKNNISISDFDFKFAGHGHYKVTYTSPITQKEWSKTTDNMPLIDSTKNTENVTKVALNELKRMCKS